MALLPVYSRCALPAVFVADFELDGRDPVFRTRKGSMFGRRIPHRLDDDSED
jgi:hypothetical protein